MRLLVYGLMVAKFMPESPYFSVIIPAYNAEKYLDVALKSVYQQTFTDYEIVVVNDGSTDNTQGILAAQKDLRLRVITQKNGGECEARNRGIKEARGQFIAFLDADDAWAPNHLAIARQFFLNHPEYVWYYTKPARFVDDSELMQQASDDKPGCYMVQNWFAEVAELPLSSSCVLKKSALPMLNIFPVGVKIYGDNVGWCRFACKNSMIGTNSATTAYYRISAESVSSVMYYEYPYKKDNVAVLLYHRQMYGSAEYSPEAKLFFRCFAAILWKQCMRTMRMKYWLPEILQHTEVNGRLITWTLLFCEKLSYMFVRVIEMIIMIRVMSLRRKLRGIGKKQRRVIS